MLYRTILLLVVFGSGLSHAASACDSLVDLSIPEAISFSDATQRLGNFLTLGEVPQTNDQQTAEQIKCYLNTQAEQLDLLAAPAIQLSRMADRVFAANSLNEKRAAIASINRSVNQDAGTGFLQLPNSITGTTEIDLFADILQNRCSAEASSDCSSALSLATNLWWIGRYFRGLSSILNQDDIAASTAFNDRLDRMWRSYKDDTILLWPQEVLLNSLTYNPETEGLNEPPSYKLLSLRPSLGLSYFSDQDDHVLPSLNVDLLGIYWWKYAGADGATAQPGRGIAATMVWDGSDTAFGLTYHHNPKWSATIAHGDKNDVVLSISFQLGWWLLR